MVVGNQSVPYDVYGGLFGPIAFGSGVDILASNGSGDRFGILGLNNLVIVPGGYTSGSSINGSTVFTGDTLSGLGLTPGIYSFTLPHDTVTVNIGAAAVPEASTTVSLGLLLALGMGGVVVAKKRRKA